MHFSEFGVSFSARCELARGRGYRTDSCQHGRKLEEWSLARVNSAHPLQVTSHKSGAVTQLQRPLPTLKLFLSWMSLGDLEVQWFHVVAMPRLDFNC